MNTSTVVAALMLHNQSCSACRMGEPCLVTERIQDEWRRCQVMADEWLPERRLEGQLAAPLAQAMQAR